MPEIQIGDLATWVSAVVAVGSAVFAAISSRGAEKHQREAAEHQREAAKHQQEVAKLQEKNAHILADQRDLQLRSWKDQYFKDVRAWADEVCRAISSAQNLADFPGLVDDKQIQYDIRVRLSALLDSGRWYFPNKDTGDNHGNHKPAAYRGHRQEILTCVLKAYNLVGNISRSNGPEMKGKLMQCQRVFVSHVQQFLDPRKREDEFRQVLQWYENTEKLRAVEGEIH